MTILHETEALLKQGRLDDAWCAATACIRSLEIDDDGLEVLHEAVILANLYAERRLYEWCEIFEARAREQNRWTDRIANGLRAIQLASLHNDGRILRYRRDKEQIDWSVLEGLPTLAIARFQSQLRQGETDEALRSALHAVEAEASRTADGSREVTHALVLFILVGFELERNLQVEAAQPAQRLFTLCERSDRVLLKLLAMTLRGRLGVHALWTAQFETASQHFAVGEELATQFHVSHRRRHFADRRALAYIDYGRHEKARDVLRANPIPGRGARRLPWLHLTTRVVDQALAFIRLGDLDVAAKLVRRASDRQKSGSNHLLSAMSVLLRSMLKFERARRSRATRDRMLRDALELSWTAETKLRESGSLATTCVCLALNERAKIQIARRHFDEAIADLRESISISAGQYRHCDGFSILQKSYALLEMDSQPSREALYEEILRELGKIGNPAVLFEVVANLYLFSWDLGDRLDLTVHHFEQIEKLRESLDEDVFTRLYTSHVLEPIARRTLLKMFNCRPEDLIQ